MRVDWGIQASVRACLLGELLNFCIDVNVVRETHFICAADDWMLVDDIAVLSAFSRAGLVWFLCLMAYQLFLGY